MIALSPGSLCDVCAEEYGPHNYPHSIPCGHVLCLSCCKNILEKTSARSTPRCPFCRDSFASDGIRVVRVDYTPTSSGWSTPTPRGIHDVIVESDVEDTLSLGLQSREQAKRLESKVKWVAGKRCSVEEVSTLHKELQDWLASKVKPREQTSSLELSAALLRAILLNHLAHSEATKAWKSTETELHHKIEELEMSKTKLETELRNVRHENSEMSQECQSLRAEMMGRAKTTSSASAQAVSPTKSVASLQSGGLTSPARPRTALSSPTGSDPRSRATSPTSPMPFAYPSQIHAPLASRAGATISSSHARSASALPSSAGHRSITPAVRAGAATPVSPVKSALKSRRMSVTTPSPLKMERSTSSGSSSDEKILMQKDGAHTIQRWLPNMESTSPPSSLFGSYFTSANTPSSRSRTPSAASAAFRPPMRYKTPVSAHSP